MHCVVFKNDSSYKKIKLTPSRVNTALLFLSVFSAKIAVIIKKKDNLNSFLRDFSKKGKNKILKYQKHIKAVDFLDSARSVYKSTQKELHTAE